MSIHQLVKKVNGSHHQRVRTPCTTHSAIHFFNPAVMKDNYHFSLSTPFTPSVSPPADISKPAYWFIFRKEELLVTQGPGERFDICSHVPENWPQELDFKQYLGRYGAIDCFVIELQPTTEVPPAMEFKSLRSLFGKLDGDIFTLAGRAIQILHWHRENSFCGKCGQAMRKRKDELAKICPACSFVSFPRLSPAVIMSILKDDQILLARSPRFPTGMYSTLAGFVEPGENLEEAVQREVKEEVGICICNIKYVASQPWPFPHSLMIGFSADYSSGELCVDNREIVDAGWYTRDTLPLLPSKISIARLLIDNFIHNRP